jgi:hypothetical protein
MSGLLARLYASLWKWSSQYSPVYISPSIARCPPRVVLYTSSPCISPYLACKPPMASARAQNVLYSHAVPPFLGRFAGSLLPCAALISRFPGLMCTAARLIVAIYTVLPTLSHMITVAEWSNAPDLNALHASSESGLFGGVRSNRAGDVVLFGCLASRYDVWEAV